MFLKAIRSLEDVLGEPAPAVYCRSLGSSAVELAVHFWFDQTRSSQLDVTSQAVQAVKEAAAREGINLPCPIQTVRLRQLAQEEPL